MAKPIENNDDHRLQYLIVRPEKGTIWNLLHFSLFGHIPSFSRFIDTKLLHENNSNNDKEEQEETSSLVGPIHDHRWIILVSVLVRKIIGFFAKPMKLFGFLVDFVLNLLSHNGNLLGLLHNIIHGQIVIPERGTETFISTIGQLDGRIDLYKEIALKPEMGNRPLMDLCIMASKLAYENAQMHFVDFYNCWNDFQNKMSTQVFILCDKAKDANFILISFRGTELFAADDWITDFDYSWYEIPKMGKVHIGFLEALGLGNRVEPASFYFNLQVKNRKLSSSTDSSSDSDSDISSTSETQVEKKTAYYTLRTKLRSLLEEHRNAKFIVTGHSLGGALAILFPTVLVMHEEMDIMEKLLGVYTFGQPRIGNRQLGMFMESHLKQHGPKYFRVVYCNDLVPRLPYDNKTFLYKHFGVCLHYNSLYNEKVGIFSLYLLIFVHFG
ncbi:hypothetical protein TanjilG_27434 [Lupinus angustifolius]|uniref:Fungal lipase-type domain-containing protein n=1 Tax=Lupinus angustifolius TaxID=3871 RepID=A0A1J7IS56_LUPAN|nr:hypothetical protein TanjilG_27434 [Lupinus angustifolius]